jgi:hypothetical protein
MAINIDPERVRQAGNDLLDQVAGAKDRIADLFSSTTTAVTAHPGWLTSTALDDCRVAWHERFDALVDRTSRTASHLIDASTSVSQRDEEAAGRLGNVLDELAGP